MNPVPRLLESDVSKVVRDWLATIPGLRIWRRNIGSRKWKDRNGKDRLMKFAEPGQSDLWGWQACRDGGTALAIHVEIELKRPGKKPTPDQEEWLALCLDAGSIAIWCDSLEMCVTKLRAAFIEKGLGWKDHWNPL